MKTVHKEGFDAHDWGMGWYDQERRIQNSPYTPGPIDMYAKGNQYENNNLDKQKIENIIRQACIQSGARDVQVQVTGDQSSFRDTAIVELTISYTHPEMRAINVKV